MIRCKWASKREGGQGACEKRFLLDRMEKKRVSNIPPIHTLFVDYQDYTYLQHEYYVHNLIRFLKQTTNYANATNHYHNK